MHYVYVCARWDPKKTWVLGHFQITMAEVEAIMTDWKDDWKHDVNQDELSRFEDEEETLVDEKDEQEEVESVVAKKKTQKYSDKEEENDRIY